MTTAAITVVASLLVMAVIGYIIGWNRGHAAVVQRDLWRQREVDQLRLRLHELQEAAPSASADADLAEQLAERDREIELRSDQGQHLQRQLDETQRRLDETQRKLDMLAQVEPELGDDALLRQLQERNEELEAEVRRGAVRLEELGTALEGAQTEAEDHSQDKASSRNIADGLEREVEEYRARLDLATEEIRSLQEAVDAGPKLERELARRDERIAELQTRDSDREHTVADEIGRARLLQSRNEELEGALRDLQQSDEERAAALEATRGHLAELEARYASTTAEREERRRSIDAERLAATRDQEKATALARELQREVERLDAVRRDAEQTLTALEASARDTEQSLHRTLADLELLEERYQTQLEERDIETDRLQERLQERTAETRELRQELDTLRSGLRRNESTLEAERRARTTAEAAHAELAAEAGELGSELAIRSQALDRLRQEAAELEQRYREQVARREVAIEELRQRTHAAETDADDAREAAHEHERTVERLEARLGESTQRGERLGEQVGELESELGQSHERAAAERNEAARQAELHRDTIQELEQERAALQAEAQSLQEGSQTLRSELDRAHEAANLADKEAARRLRERDAESRHLMQTLQSRDDELQHAAADAQKLEQDVGALRGELDESVSQSERLRGDLAVIEQNLGGARTDLQRRDTTIEALRGDLQEVEDTFERRLRAVIMDNEATARMLTTREAEVEQGRRRLERLQDRLETVQRRLHQRQVRLDDLETRSQRLDRVRDRLLREVHDREQEARLLRQHAAAQPKLNDDLTKIHGIGRATQRKLAELGITSYRQLVYLEKRDIDWIQERLPTLRGRINAARWRADARAAHHAKYGSKLG